MILGNGDGSFQSPVTTTVTGSTVPTLRDLALVDTDGDGVVDLFAASRPDTNRLQLRANTSTPGNVAVGATSVIANTSDNGAIIAADIDGDGGQEIITGGNEDALTIYYPAGPSAGTAVFIDMPADASMLVASDVNGDGRVDLVAGIRKSILIVENLGNGVFASESYLVDTTGPASDFVAVAWGDFNGDGILDYVPWYNFASSTQQSSARSMMVAASSVSISKSLFKRRPSTITSLTAPAPR